MDELYRNSQQFATLVDSDINLKLIPLMETIDDTIMRLEEFESLIKMAQEVSKDVTGSNGGPLHIHENYRDGLMSLCSRTDALERLVSRVKTDLDVLESRVEKAENELGGNEQNSIKTLLKPFLKKPSDSKTHVNKNQQMPYEFFKLENYFPK